MKSSKLYRIPITTAPATGDVCMGQPELWTSWFAGEEDGEGSCWAVAGCYKGKFFPNSAVKELVFL